MSAGSAAAHEPRLARAAAVIADPARSRMLALLLSGHFASAGELARAASVSPSTASGHLAQLRDSGFVVCEPRGRHRYFRLADAEIAQALQALALVAERNSHDRAWAAPVRRQLREARCCYGHLAGRLGVALFDCLCRHDRLVNDGPGGLKLTESGTGWLDAIGFEPAARAPNRRFAYGCLDWSERRDHLAGSLASQLLDHFIARDWLRPAAQGQRALVPTVAGRRLLLPHLGVD